MTKKRYLNTYDEVFSAVLQAVDECDIQIENINKDNGIIKAKSRGSLRSWGEDISIKISEIEREIEVFISSKPKAQLIDWGKSQENISRLFKQLETHL